jgi:hypothetical protein
MNIPSIFTYTSDVGAVAFNSMAAFMASVRPGNGYSGLALVSGDVSKSKMIRSVSAFALNSVVLGDGNVGGSFNALASLELPRVEHPLFSVFTVATKNNFRTFNSHHPTGGDGNYLAAVQMNAPSAKTCHNKIYPIFKPIDIYEFIHRFALVLVDVFQKAFNDSDIKMEYTTLDMNINDFSILLYQQIMLSFADSQLRVQSMLPYRGAVSNQFTPFILDTCQAGNSANGALKLPKFMNLNIQGLRPRSLATTINPKNGKSVQYNQRHWLPVWGQYTDWRFVQDDYFYIGPNGDKVFIFSSTGDTINLYTNTINNTVVDMGNSPLIFVNLRKLNRILSTYSPYIQELETINNEPGPAIFEVIGETMILKEVAEKNSDVKKEKDSASKSSKSKKAPKITIKDKVVVAVTSQKPVISEIYTQLYTFVKPEVLLFTPSPGQSGVITTQSWQIYSHESNIAQAGSQTSTDNEYLSIDEIRKDYVSNCTKNRGGDNAAIVDIAKHFDAQGNAGLLDNIAGISNTVLQSFVGLAPLLFV